MKIFKYNISKGCIFLCILLLCLLLSNLFFFRASPYYNKFRVSLGLSKKAERADWMLYAWTNSLQSLNDTVDIAFFGHSIVCFGDFKHYFPDKKSVNLGFPGENIDGMKTRLPQLVAVHPKKVFVMAGTNTIGRFSEEKVKDKYTSLLLSIKDSLPGSTVYVHDVLPVVEEREEGSKGVLTNDKIVKFNAFVESFCKDNGFVFVPLHDLYTDDKGELVGGYTEDGLHLTGKSYKLWADKIREYVYN